MRLWFNLGTFQTACSLGWRRTLHLVAKVRSTGPRMSVQGRQRLLRQPTDLPKGGRFVWQSGGANLALAVDGPSTDGRAARRTADCRAPSFAKSPSVLA